MTERETCAEILARHISPNYESNFQDTLNALLEARDLARREALETAAKVCDDLAPSYRAPGYAADGALQYASVKIRSLISQPSSETVKCDAHLCVTGNYEKGDRRDCKYENPPPKSASASVPAEPIPMRLVCPRCGTLHLDVGEFATKPHHTHACQQCGEVWRPAIVATVGVEFLPGFKNEPAPPDTEAWKRVPVEAGMFRQAYISAAAETGRTRTPPDLEDFISAIERAARAKLGE